MSLSNTEPGPVGAPAPRAIATRCAIAGGGPAGMMLGFLLARAGIDVVVLEKHPDFLRDFRGDTIHPSTLQLLHELGLLEAFLALPHQQIRQVRAQIGDTMLTVADFSHLPTVCRFLALMPQWDFLNFLAANAQRYPAFHLMLETPVRGLIVEAGNVRPAAGLSVTDIGAPMDVLWLRVPREPGDPPEVLGRIDFGKLLVLLDRGDYWQCGYIIPKGAFDGLQRTGIAAFRAGIAALVPWLGERLGAVRGWDDVKLLTVTVDRLREWYRPGLLCIGDAAHAMSPIGGVGINLAVQDAVAAANALYRPLLHGPPGVRDLSAVQRRRAFPMAAVQRVQVAVQNGVIGRILGVETKMKPPLFLRAFAAIPLLRRIPGYLIGIGIRPERIRTPETPQ